MHASRRVPLAALLLAIAACHPEFKAANYSTNEALYRAASEEFKARRWDNAIAAFEKLTTDLSPRDTLLPRSHWYLARAHQEQGEWVLAATSFNRLVESFPDDSLADDAALEAGRSFKKMWRKPTLDPTYGESARAAYQTLLGLYPQSPLVPTAQKELGEVEEMFAQKNYLAGMYYLRRGGFDSGIIYFKDVVSKYPTTPTARLAQLRLVDAYKAIRYKEDAADVCAVLRKSYPEDVEVRTTCTGVGSTTTTGAVPVPPSAPTSSTGPPASLPARTPATSPTS
ncbi:MAG: outer rane assembly lipoprotein YfiO [Gemmatimonadetes bacterium]|jgi:outer membrane protein assembly factor BamD|nr:outer rane assembly lipoprotein YfiO [Gemmatimonadota bacterium]